MMSLLVFQILLAGLNMFVECRYAVQREHKLVCVFGTKPFRNCTGWGLSGISQCLLPNLALVTRN
jgi:hypothetical protein